MAKSNITEVHTLNPSVRDGETRNSNIVLFSRRMPQIRTVLKAYAANKFE